MRGFGFWNNVEWQFQLWTVYLAPIGRHDKHLGKQVDFDGDGDGNDTKVLITRALRHQEARPSPS